MRPVSEDLVRFITGIKFEDLPIEVVHQVKRGFIDSIGCALSGIATEKGKIAITMAKRLGGTAESTIIGVGGKVSCTNAAYVNGELINGIDMDAIPHIHPFVIPPVLAIGESTSASGKELIVASAIAQELARRFSKMFMSMVANIVKKGTTPDVFGNGNEHILGAVAGAGRLMNLKSEQMAHALGIASYFCSLPVCRDWESTMPKSMIKYAPVGWLCQGSVTAALLAEEGFTGNPTVLDGEYGFPQFYGVADSWNPEFLLNKLGEQWMFSDTNYKPYPCCRFLHSQLDCFIEIIEENNLYPEQIESVKAYSIPFLAHPDQQNVTTQIDSQFSGPYVIAAAAYRIKSGPAWQDMDTIMDPKIQLFMKKVSMLNDATATETKSKEPNSWPARVEVLANGKTYIKETKYSRGTDIEGYRLSDEDIIKKFKVNATRVLTQTKIDKTIKYLMDLENAEDVSELFKLIVL